VRERETDRHEQMKKIYLRIIRTASSCFQLVLPLNPLSYGVVMGQDQLIPWNHLHDTPIIFYISQY